MEHAKFDALTRQMPEFFGRRQLSRAGIGAALGLTGLATLTDEAGAKKKKCKNGKKRCDGKCVNTLRDKKNCGKCGKQCGSGEICVTGLCARECPTVGLKCRGFGPDAGVVCRETGDGRQACLQDPVGSCAADVVASCEGNPCLTFGKVCAEFACPDVLGSSLTCLSVGKQ